MKKLEMWYIEEDDYPVGIEDGDLVMSLPNNTPWQRWPLPVCGFNFFPFYPALVLKGVPLFEEEPTDETTKPPG